MAVTYPDRRGLKVLNLGPCHMHTTRKQDIRPYQSMLVHLLHMDSSCSSVSLLFFPVLNIDWVTAPNFFLRASQLNVWNNNFPEPCPKAFAFIFKFLVQDPVHLPFQSIHFNGCILSIIEKASSLKSQYGTFGIAEWWIWKSRCLTAPVSQTRVPISGIVCMMIVHLCGFTTDVVSSFFPRPQNIVC